MSTPSWSLDEDLAFWRRAGITNVGLSLRKLEAAGLEVGVGKVSSAGLRVTNLLGLGFPLADRSRWPAHQRRLVAAVEAAAAVGAECFVLTTGGPGPLTWEEAAAALGEALAPVLDACRDRGVRLALEHTNSLRVDVSFVHTLRDALDLAAALGTGVVMEVNACWAERSLAATIAGGVDSLALVQVSDFVVGTLQTPDRAVPGDGDIPLGRILAWLEGAGYRGVYDLEMMGPRIEAEGYEHAVVRALGRLEALLAAVGTPGT
jgi:sugar phosphate isomerase/epimerase